MHLAAADKLLREDSTSFPLSLVAFADTFVDERSKMSLIALLDI
jgi:hypothetical protein